jgi:hypothetical protein
MSTWRTLRILRRAAWKLARALLFGWLYWLQRPPGGRRRWQIVGAISILMAVGMTIALLVTLPARLAAIEHPTTIVSHEIGCDRMLVGGTYFIEVNGARYQCTGADSWCPPSVAPPLLVYDDQNPAHCRVARNVGRLSRWELTCVLESIGGLAVGLALALVRENDPKTLRKLIGHGALLIAIGLQILIWKFDLVGLH